MTTPARPVLRWHGGKWMLAPWIIDHFPPHRVYTEAFGGAASVLLRKPRAYAEVYNDLDQEVVGLFRLLREPSAAAELRRRVDLTPFSRAEFEQAYEFTEEPFEQARRLIVRSFFGHGSDSPRIDKSVGFRQGGHDGGRAPSRDWTNYPSALEAIAERLRGVLVECRPAAEVIEAQDRPDALHFVDPPYLLSTRKAGSAGSYRHEMTDADHRDLARVLRAVLGGVVLSGYPSPLYDEDLYPDWNRVARSALADGASKRTEVLWINQAAWSAGARLL
ncbi:MAG: DNA adenine methylase [bacterium]